MTTANTKAPAAAIQRFQDNRFGMFIHYGLYSLLGRREWAMYYERIPVDEYRKLAERFRPSASCVEDWVLLAKQSGMKYACLTARHHEGFCLFDTATTDFNSVKTAAGRDLVREFVEVCRKHEVRPALYYSVGDWSDAGYTDGVQANPEGWRRFVETGHRQLKELMSNYGPIDYLFYDAAPLPETWDAAGINNALRELQPDLLISDRGRVPEDVASSEQHTKSYDKPWECCLTMNASWGRNDGDPHYKCVYDLVHTVATCMHNGGNVLLNIGPLADGSVHPEERRLLNELGGWVNRNQEAVYGTTRAPFDYHDYMLSCARGHTVYMAIHFYHGPETIVCGVGNRVRSIRLLHPAQDIAFHQEGDRVLMTGLPAEWPDVMPVIAMDLDGPPRGVPNPYACGSSKFTF